MSETFQITTLPNRLRIVTVPMGGVKSTVVGTWVGVGSRSETKAHNGITHFLEHMFFKGTTTKNTRQISESIEALGGQINANTGHERTTYYTKVLGEHLPQGFNTIADMMRNSTFPQAELDRERLVVIEEIKRSVDDHNDHLSDRFIEKCFSGQSLGRPILGPPEVIRALSRQDLFDYVAKHYTPDRMVVSAAGNVDHNQLVDLANKAYGDMKPASRIIHPRPAKYRGGGDVRIARAMEQVQIYTAFKGAGDQQTDRPIYGVLTQVLGGGMSSPLFQKIREERGLVYTVSPFNYSFTDVGVFGVAAGLSPKRAPEYLDVLAETLRETIDKVTQEDLQKAKNRLIAGTAFSLESVYGQANQAAEYLLHEGKIRSMEERIARANAVTLDDLRRVHAEIFATKPTLAAIGDVSHLESYDKFAARFSALAPKP